MNILDAFWLGIVEGLTEFLPVSSTGHLILAARFLHIPSTEFIKSFEVAIQLGAIAAVVVLYGRTLLLNLEIIKRVIAAFIPTAVLGLIFYKIIKKLFLNNDVIVVWALLLGGIFLIVFERLHKEGKDSIDDLEKLSYKKAFLIGLVQSLAMVPGVSRSAATIIGGLALGLKRRTIVEFSFLLAIPTMLAATVLDLFKSAGSFSSAEFGLLGLGFVTSFAVAILSIKFLLNYIKNHNFTLFGVYRIMVAFLFWR